MSLVNDPTWSLEEELALLLGGKPAWKGAYPRLVTTLGPYQEAMQLNPMCERCCTEKGIKWLAYDGVYKCGMCGTRDGVRNTHVCRKCVAIHPRESLRRKLRYDEKRLSDFLEKLEKNFGFHYRKCHSCGPPEIHA